MKKVHTAWLFSPSSHFTSIQMVKSVIKLHLCHFKKVHSHTKIKCLLTQAPFLKRVGLNKRVCRGRQNIKKKKPKKQKPHLLQPSKPNTMNLFSMCTRNILPLKAQRLIYYDAQIQQQSCQQPSVHPGKTPFTTLQPGYASLAQPMNTVHKRKKNRVYYIPARAFLSNSLLSAPHILPKMLIIWKSLPPSQLL